MAASDEPWERAKPPLHPIASSRSNSRLILQRPFAPRVLGLVIGSLPVHREVDIDSLNPTSCSPRYCWNRLLGRLFSLLTALDGRSSRPDLAERVEDSLWDPGICPSGVIGDVQLGCVAQRSGRLEDFSFLCDGLDASVVRFCAYREIFDLGKRYVSWSPWSCG